MTGAAGGEDDLPAVARTGDMDIPVDHREDCARRVSLEEQSGLGQVAASLAGGQEGSPQHGVFGIDFEGHDEPSPTT